MGYSAVAILGFAAFLSFQAMAGAPTDVETFRQEALSLIQKKETALSYADWIESGDTPATWISSLPKTATPRSLVSRCQALASLTGEQLTHFEGIFERLPCTAELQAKAQAYWEQARLSFAAPQTPTRLPNVEKHIDAATGPYYTRGELKEGEIAFTFDDGPHPTRTQRILNILSDYGVRATFFETGPNATQHPEISRQAALAGHSVASHTWNHLEMTKLSLAAAEMEFDRGRAAVTVATGVDVPFFRFPYGSKNPALLQMMKSKQIASFFWNMDTRDWGTPNPELLYQNVLKELNREKGGIILFHDVHEQTVIVLPRVLEELRARNFTTYVFVPH